MKDILPKGLYYKKFFINRQERSDILNYLKTLYPIWENRFSEHHPPPPEDEQRELLRPVYWLGNWQFACLGYYHPPKGYKYRCVYAEPYPKLLRELINRIEFIAKKELPKNYIPEKWHLNTCLINYYGDKIENGKKVDRARVGDHQDFEPGPVASLSLGERAFFQFVAGKSTLGRENVIFEQWLEDSSLQIFAGPKWKDELFHRVQRVEKKRKEIFDLNTKNFETRRINFTFRYVPTEHFHHWKDLPKEDQADTKGYVQELAQHSEFFKKFI
ncbi:MAG: alpha-ketoglutarate-dependent dioxygenase AlkB [Bacteriovoracaceae bacterium]|nr:alpha-ketoglutarate-dependent dioxygenase AlkB [Bacteriovoracaceae bacterium]